MSNKREIPEDEKAPNLERLLDLIENSIEGAEINLQNSEVSIPLKDYEVTLNYYGNTKNYNIHIKKRGENTGSDELSFATTTNVFKRYNERLGKLYNKIRKNKEHQDFLAPLKKTEQKAYEVLKSIEEIKIPLSGEVTIPDAVTIPDEDEPCLEDEDRCLDAASFLDDGIVLEENDDLFLLEDEESSTEDNKGPTEDKPK
jgi:hypothetical protein